MESSTTGSSDKVGVG